MNRSTVEVIPAPRPVSPARAEEFRLQLERVLSSQIFRNSQRCQVLLRYIGERAAVGDTASLKERTLGIDVFGRAPDYDTSQQPIVRATAAEIRKKLAQYYQAPEHAGEPRIQLAPGSYVPEFRDIGELPAAPVSRRPVWLAALAGALIGTLLSVSAYLLLSRASHTSLDQFWQPVLQAPAAVVFGLGKSGTYTLVGESSEREWKVAHGMLDASKEANVPMQDILPMYDRYYAVGDVNAAIRIAGLLEKRGKPYAIQGVSSVSFSELREHPAVLIGAFNNEWAMRAQSQLRFTFAMDGDTMVVRDRLHPAMNDWKVVEPWPQPHVTMDYAIVSRLVDPATDRIVVVAAGMTDHGTAAAGEFLSTPGYFAEAVPKLPSGWMSRSLQVVLGIPVVQGAPGRPRVLATHAW